MSYTVVYIGGAGRSGSTLLEILLGSEADAFCVGELRELFRYYQDPEMPCSCEEYIVNCPTWNRILKKVESTGFDLKRLASVSSDLTRSRHIWRLFFARQKLLENDDWQYLCQATKALYDAIAEETGADYIIDGSKSALQLQMLKSFLGNDNLKIIHQIRDPRGVAYSWSKNIKLIKTENGTVEFPRRSYYGVSFRWLFENLAIERLAKQQHYARVNYEELAENPSKVISLVTEQLNLENMINSTLSLDSKIKAKKVTHSVGGNPMRKFADGAKISCDIRWQSELSLVNKLGLGLLTYPMLKRYRYQLIK